MVRRLELLLKIFVVLAMALIAISRGYSQNLVSGKKYSSIRKSAEFSATKKKTNVKPNSLMMIEKKEKSFEGFWKLGLSSGKASDEVSKSTSSSAYASAWMKYYLHSDFSFQLAPQISFSAGQAQSLYGELDETNRLSLSEASMLWRPVWFFDLAAGILNQNRLNNVLLVKNTAFPGIVGRFTLMKYNEVNTFFESQAVIPTSYSFDSEAQKLEKTPSLYTQTLRTVISPASFFKTELWISYFAFNDLPSVVAQKSRLHGNTVSNGYDFDYQYEGISTGAETTLDIFENVLDMTLGARYLKNNEAPDSLNTATMLDAKLRLQTTSYEVDIVPSIIWFENKPDASVAYYNSSELGNSNRQGYVYGINIDFNRFHFSLKGKYIDSHLIYKDPFHTRRRTVEIALETLNVQF